MSKHKLVLLPGFDGTGELFADLCHELNQHVKILVIRYTEEVTIDDYVAAINAQIGHDDPILLLAESFSGPIALHFMNRYPDRVKRCIFSTSFSKTPFLSLCKSSRLLPNLFFQNHFLQTLALKNFCYGNYFTPTLGATAQASLNKVTPVTIKNRLQLLSTQQAHQLLEDKNHSINMPCLYLQANEDKIVSASISKKLIKALPNVRNIVVNGPHLLLQIKPKECANHILDFCEIRGE